jgi:hypothetical protein
MAIPAPPVSLNAGASPPPLAGLHLLVLQVLARCYAREHPRRPYGRVAVSGRLARRNAPSM